MVGKVHGQSCVKSNRINEEDGDITMIRAGTFERLRGLLVLAVVVTSSAWQGAAPHPTRPRRRSR